MSAVDKYIDSLMINDVGVLGVMSILSLLPKNQELADPYGFVFSAVCHIARTYSESTSDVCDALYNAVALSGMGIEDAVEVITDIANEKQKVKLGWVWQESFPYVVTTVIEIVNTRYSQSISNGVPYPAVVREYLGARRPAMNFTLSKHKANMAVSKELFL